MTDLFGAASILSHHADPEAVDSFIAWRKAIKKPLTDRAAKMIAKTLQQINAEGGDATEALDLAQEHGWQTIKPEWYWRIKNGNRGNNMAAGRPANANTGEEQGLRAARFIRSPSKNSF